MSVPAVIDGPDLNDEPAEAHGRHLPLHGRYDPRFRPFVDAFIENYRAGDELGSSVSVVVGGRPVVDVWGGWTDSARTEEWGQDTFGRALMCEPRLLILDEPSLGLAPVVVQRIFDLLAEMHRADGLARPSSSCRQRHGG